MSVVKYLKSAFTYHWNLLAFLGGLGFAALSGMPDVVGPLVLAAEAAYLGMLGTHPKFQRYVDAQAAKFARSKESAGAEETLREIVESLPKESIQRFKSLRERCLDLRQIARDLKTTGNAETGLPLDDFQMAGLDKLLWIYLRLLYTQYALGRFLERTKEEAIQADVAHLQERLKRADMEPDAALREKVKKTLQDNLETCRNRLGNFQKARGNFELLELEIDRLENKIQSLSELAVNRQEPDFISGQVDQVASSMVDTERTMNDLQFATGLQPLDEAVPSLLERATVKARR
ncbi:MAG TPA: hypothetical protein VMV69_18220 [Pirellulales bacterium]|nr:hypothetical protein [Pirellulales bacterium]